MSDGSLEAGGFCVEGCYWECEHARPAIVEATTAEVAERARLHAVTADDRARPLLRCAECGEDFRDAVRHARDHVRMRQLGWLSRSDSLR